MHALLFLACADSTSGLTCAIPRIVTPVGLEIPGRKCVGSCLEVDCDG